MRALAAGGGETVIVNTCAVTGEAVRQARQAIRKAKRANPAAQVIVTGCAAQIEPQTFAAMPEVSRVLGNIDKFEPANLRFDDADVPDVRVSDIMAVRETAPHLLGGFAERTRAFAEVMTEIGRESCRVRVLVSVGLGGRRRIHK